MHADHRGSHTTDTHNSALQHTNADKHTPKEYTGLTINAMSKLMTWCIWSLAIFS